MSRSHGSVRTVTRRARGLVAVLVGVALLASGCASATSGAGSIERAADSTLPVVGDTRSPLDQTAKNALTDVLAFWRQQYPKVSGGKPFPELTGGYYSADAAAIIKTGSVPAAVEKEACLKSQTSFIIDNAAYCRLDDSVIWDNSPGHIWNQLQQKYGQLVFALFLAHEIGHAISNRLGVFDRDLPTIDTESQADCAAGAWAATLMHNQAPHFRNMQGQFDNALIGFLDGRDSTPDQPADISHGNGFDRLAAVAEGIDKGVTFCFSPNYFDRTFTERPYVTDKDYGQTDAQNGGNESLQQVLDPTPIDPDNSTGGGGLQPDLNRFWKSAAQSINKSWTDVKIAAADHPKCGATPTSEFGYCPDDNTVYYSNSFAHDAYYSLPDLAVDHTNADVKLLFNQPSDFALGTLFAVAWGVAVRHQLFGRSTDDEAALLAAVCYTGAYAKDVNRKDFSDGHDYILSPPDLDESTWAMLSLIGQDRAFGARGTDGLQRVLAFVKGYGGGLSVC
jgi:predicted metalloprotease